jgi:ribosome-binding factor A
MAGSQHHRYSRLDRVNEALREVIGDELERIDDDLLELVTVTGVEVDSDLRRARVWFDTLKPHEEVGAALAVHRVQLQAAVGRQLRMKRTPELSFSPDPAIAVGTRVEEILRRLHHDDVALPEHEGEDGQP